MSCMSSCRNRLSQVVMFKDCQGEQKVPNLTGTGQEVPETVPSAWPNLSLTCSKPSTGWRR